MKQLPPPEDIARIRRDARMNRAVEAYKFFYPTVSMVLNFDALEQNGAAVNRGFLMQLTTPKIVTLTQNSDTVYGLSYGDMTDVGPLVVELPAGPILGVVDDANFQLVTNMGIVGEDAGEGAKYLFVPPGYEGDLPDDGYIVKNVPTNRFLVCARAPFPDPEKGKALLRTLRFYPLAEADSPVANTFLDVSDQELVANPYVVDGTADYWTTLKRALDEDVPSERLYIPYGLLADIGIRHDRTFEPDDDLAEVLAEAARTADEQLAIAAFAGDAPERLVWPDRRWEWVVWSEGDFGYYERDFLRWSVRERWFYQATLETDKMFMQKEGAGSIYWLAAVDAGGAALDGAKAYTLAVPGPVPAGQFWSVTLYDLHTRSEIDTPQGKPLLTSLRDPLSPDAAGEIVMRFGPDRPDDDALWIETTPGSQWFAYFRIYGPGAAAFDGSWRPSDFTRES